MLVLKKFTINIDKNKCPLSQIEFDDVRALS
jgi:hypothetical protein